MFRLTYNPNTPDTLSVVFGTSPPEATAFHPIVNGFFHKNR